LSASGSGNDGEATEKTTKLFEHHVLHVEICVR
jgi:hypothetical protein